MRFRSGSIDDQPRYNGAIFSSFGYLCAMDLDRFVAAQKNVFPQALAEIRQGRKTSHWMWFIFPQLKGLGHSSNALYYGITDLAEATAYCRYPILGTRLIEISRALLSLPGNNATSVIGSPDDVKLYSS